MWTWAKGADSLVVWCKNKMGQSQKYLSNLKNKTVPHFVLLVLSRRKVLLSIHSLYQSNHHLWNTLTLVHAGNTVLNYTDMMTDIGGGEFFIRKDRYLTMCCGDLSPVNNNAFQSLFWNSRERGNVGRQIDVKMSALFQICLIQRNKRLPNTTPLTGTYLPWHRYKGIIAGFLCCCS